MTSKIVPFPVLARPRADAPRAPHPALRTVTFAHPFLLPGMTAPHRPGTFEVMETREALDVVWEAYRISTTILLVDGPVTEAWAVAPMALVEALALDQSRG